MSLDERKDISPPPALWRILAGALLLALLTICVWLMLLQAIARLDWE